MEIVNIAATEPEKPEKPALFGEIVKDGFVMNLEIRLEEISRNTSSIDQFVGFMERQKIIGINIMSQLQQRRNEAKAMILKQTNNNGFMNFLRRKKQ